MSDEIIKQADEASKGSAASFMALAAGLAATTPDGVAKFIETLLGGLTKDEKPSTPLDLRTSPITDLLHIDMMTLAADPRLDRAAAIIAALRALISVADIEAETAKKNAKTLYGTKMDKALGEAAKRRLQLEKEISDLKGIAAAKDAEMIALNERIDKEALLLDAIAKHVDQPRPSCACVACRMHMKLKDMQAKLDEMKTKNAEMKETLKGFTGPRSKKK